MNKTDWIMWDNFRKANSNKISAEEYKMLCTLHSIYFKHQYYEPCTCSKKTINSWISQLNEIHENGFK